MALTIDNLIKSGDTIRAFVDALNDANSEKEVYDIKLKYEEQGDIITIAPKPGSLFCYWDGSGYWFRYSPKDETTSLNGSTQLVPLSKISTLMITEVAQ